jgi:hypothetical protein
VFTEELHGTAFMSFWTASPIEALPDWIGIGIRFIAIIYVTCLVSYQTYIEYYNLILTFLSSACHR